MYTLDLTCPRKSKFGRNIEALMKTKEFKDFIELTDNHMFRSIGNDIAFKVSFKSPGDLAEWLRIGVNDFKPLEIEFTLLQRKFKTMRVNTNETVLVLAEIKVNKPNPDGVFLSVPYFF